MAFPHLEEDIAWIGDQDQIGESGTLYCQERKGCKGDGAASQRYLDKRKYRLFHFAQRFMPQTEGRTETALVNTSRIRIWASIVSEIRAFGKLPFVFHSRMPPRHVYVDRVAIVLVFPVMVRESWVDPASKDGTRNEGEEETRSRFRLRGWSTNTYRV